MNLLVMTIFCDGFSIELLTEKLLQMNSVLSSRISAELRLRLGNKIGCQLKIEIRLMYFLSCYRLKVKQRRRICLIKSMATFSRSSGISYFPTQPFIDTFHVSSLHVSLLKI